MDAQNGGDLGHGPAGVELPQGVIAEVVSACAMYLRLPPLHGIRELLSR